MCILVAEDEFLLRHVLAEELRDAGHDVFEARSAQEAFDLAPTLPIAPRLLITDILMPGPLDGLQLAAKLRRDFENLPVIFTTGIENLSALCADKHFQNYLLRKPYTLAVAIQKSNAAFDAAHQFRYINTPLNFRNTLPK